MSIAVYDIHMILLVNKCQFLNRLLDLQQRCVMHLEVTVFNVHTIFQQNIQNVAKNIQVIYIIQIA